MTQLVMSGICADKVMYLLEVCVEHSPLVQHASGSHRHSSTYVQGLSFQLIVALLLL